MNEQMDVSTGFPSVTAGCPRSAQLHPVSLGSWYDLVHHWASCLLFSTCPSHCLWGCKISDATGSITVLNYLVPGLFVSMKDLWDGETSWGLSSSLCTHVLHHPSSQSSSVSYPDCVYVYINPSLSLLPSSESNTGKQECRRCTGRSALVAESSETL